MKKGRNRKSSQNRIQCLNLSQGAVRDNRGLSVIAVLVTITFVAILSMIAIYLAMANLRMKATALKGKDGFYMAEQPLEELKAGLQQEVGQAMSKAYLDVVESYSSADDDAASASVADSDKRKTQFKKEFLANLTESLTGNAAITINENGKTVDQYDLDTLKTKYVSAFKSSTSSQVIDTEKETLILTTADGKNPSLEIYSYGKDSDGVYLRNLKSIYVGSTGEAAVIETDIHLGIPDVEFPSPSTLPDLMNMIVVADGGIICEGGATAINGSIYAGILEDQTDSSGTEIKKDDRYSIYVKSGGALTIGSGDKVVAEGKIILPSGNTFSTGSDVNLWAEGMELSSGTVTLSGDTYFLDDLTVMRNTTTASTIEIGGSYYGYGSLSAAKSDNNYNYSKKYADGTSFYTGRSDTDLSSAIVINGKNTTLDLSGADEIMLAGRSYIGTSDVETVTGEAENKSNILTGESLTVKGTQLAYLFPAELFDTEKTGAEIAGNPLDFETYKETALWDGEKEVSERAVTITSEYVKMDEPVEAWGNKTLRDIGVNESNPVTTVFYQDPSAGGQVYFYLNFTAEKNASDFMQIYYENSTVKEKMDEYLSFYFGEGSGVTVNDPDTYLRYITGGNVLTYSGSAKTGTLKSAKDNDQAETLELGYQNTFYALNRKMISSVDLLESDFEEEDGGTHDETEPDRSVFDNLVNEDGLVKFLYEQYTDDPSGSRIEGVGLARYFTTSEENGYQAIICHNSGEEVAIQLTENGGETSVWGTDNAYSDGGCGRLKIDAGMAEKLRLVICTGDVYINENVEFQGIIMAKGKITLGKNAQLNSSPVDASRVFQAAVTDSGASPKSFFWEGDNYVLRNSSSSGSGSTSGEITDSYELADFVEYENWRKE